MEFGETIYGILELPQCVCGARGGFLPSLIAALSVAPSEDDNGCCGSTISGVSTTSPLSR
jgi:hypothetical protein